MTMENTTRTGHAVVGVFDEVGQAEQAINDLKVAGFTPDSISVVTKDRNDQRDLTEATGNEAGKGTLVGSLGGGTLGAVLGWLLAGGIAAIPGIGPVAAAGIFGATLTGALVGGTVGGISGALAGSGVPKEEAEEYEEHVRGGRTLLTVNAANGNLLEAAVDVFERNGSSSTRYYDLAQTGPGRTFTRNETGGTNAFPVEGGYNTSTTSTTTTANTGENLTSGPTANTQRGDTADDVQGAGAYTINPSYNTSVTQPTTDPSKQNQSIYAQGQSDIASPEEFERLEARRRAERIGQEDDLAGQTENQSGVYVDPTDSRLPSQRSDDLPPRSM